MVEISPFSQLCGRVWAELPRYQRGKGGWYVLETRPSEDKAFERREHVLQAYYERLNSLDTNIRELTSFFFGINTAILALVFQVIKDDLQRLVLSVIGYCVSITIFLITYKSFLAWKLYAQDMSEIEDELDYDISKKYDVRLAKTSGKSVRITLVRMRFNFLFIVLWVGIMCYLANSLLSRWSILAWMSTLSFIVLIAVIIYLPWAHLVGTGQPKLIWTVVRTLWSTEV